MRNPHDKVRTGLSKQSMLELICERCDGRIEIFAFGIFLNLATTMDENSVEGRAVFHPVVSSIRRCKVKRNLYVCGIQWMLQVCFVHPYVRAWDVMRDNADLSPRSVIVYQTKPITCSLRRIDKRPQEFLQKTVEEAGVRTILSAWRRLTITTIGLQQQATKTTARKNAFITIAVSCLIMMT